MPGDAHSPDWCQMGQWDTNCLRRRKDLSRGWFFCFVWLIQIRGGEGELQEMQMQAAWAVSKISFLNIEEISNAMVDTNKCAQKATTLLTLSFTSWSSLLTAHLTLCPTCFFAGKPQNGCFSKGFSSLKSFSPSHLCLIFCRAHLYIWTG